MEIEQQSFQTPASRRSPAQFGRQKKNDESQGIVTKAFESLKPFARDGLSNNAAWLNDKTCNNAIEDLGIVMPPIGYECELRTFRDADDVAEDPEKDNGKNYDIYENSTTIDHNDKFIDQGTISTVTDNETKNISNLNEFGFGYRNGYVFNKKNKHTPNSLLYIKNRHDSEKHILAMKHNQTTPLSGGSNGSPRHEVEYAKSKGYYGKNQHFGTGKFSLGLKDTGRKYHENNNSKPLHEFDTIEDVTSLSTGNRQNGSNRRRFHSQVQRKSGGLSFNNDGEDNDSGDMTLYDNNENNKIDGDSFRFSSEIDNETNETTGNPMAWTSKFNIFAKPAPTGEKRRDSFVSEYSNFTPDGQQRHGSRSSFH